MNEDFDSYFIKLPSDEKVLPDKDWILELTDKEIKRRADARSALENIQNDSLDLYILNHEARTKNVKRRSRYEHSFIQNDVKFTELDAIKRDEEFRSERRKRIFQEEYTFDTETFMTDRKIAKGQILQKLRENSDT